MAVFHFDVDQGSTDWYRLRSGVPTASCFDQIITPKKQELASARWRYACRLIAERLMNWQADSLDKITHIQAGRENEPLAVRQFEFVTEIETRPVGFVTTNDKRFGASPDRIIGNVAAGGVDGIVEIKAPTIPVQMQYLLLGHDEAYRCQVNGQLWVAEADKAIFYSFSPRMPAYMIETGRDEPFIAKLAAALEQFSDELEALTEKAKRLGVFQKFDEIVDPATAAYSTEALASQIEGDASMPWGG